MSNVLVLAELRGTEPKKITLEMLSAAKKIAAGTGGQVLACAIGSGLAGLGAKLGAYGAEKVFIADGVDKYNTEIWAEILANLIKQENPSVVLIGATALGRDLAPRVAVKVDAGLASDIVDFKMDGANFIAKRPVFAGKAFCDVAFSGIAVATVRPNTLPVEENAGAGEEAALATDAAAPKAQITEIIAGESGKLDLTEADCIVSGGRGMKSDENFKLLDDLADVIGATVGASRAAVDAGYAQHSMQVGQTGKVVNPTLYIACGISGAIQHLAGMRTSKVIVAINKDEEAPIFQVADYGIVADLFEALPIMTEELKKITA
ncbi:MAG: electron transfer flavoprotein subunit alpha/FixB family protein [Candidatus Lernaella stagnicola]|nr:electron transfer flavoprotein subunit alpha/FixB family protein [Candidatus Lernaella stagnicola]